jgi:uncharacterized protein
MASDVVIAGGSGIVGRRLIEALAMSGHGITVLTRGARGEWPSGVRSVRWRPTAARDGDAAELARLAEVLSGAEALVNLSGSSIAAGRLDAAHRERLRASRVDASATLLAAAQQAATPPRVWLQVTAVGIYGDRGEERLSESSPIGPASFPLVATGIAWEAAAAPAAAWSRLIVARLGVVFDRDAPAWQKMLLPIRAFVGGPLGSGRQWMPWVSGHDTAAALAWLIATPSAAGIYHVTAPEGVRQIDLARAVAAALHRPALLPAPAFALRWALGGVADALLLASARVIPERLLAEGFTFRHPTIASALPELL